MKECWAEGDLRSYLDGEMPPAERELAAAHFEECAECRGRYAELAERAARVGSLMAALSEPAAVAGEHGVRQETVHRLKHVPAAVLALAAALAIGFVMLPKRGAPGVESLAKAPMAVAPAGVAEAEPVAAAPAVVRRPNRMPRPMPRADYYFSLDGEPIETGTVMRVGVENGDLQAELILGPDGRAHAIRMVSRK